LKGMIATDNMYPNTARIFTKVGKQGGREGWGEAEDAFCLEIQ